MTHPTDLPAALPLAIATALLALVLAPLLGGSEQEACGVRTTAATHAAVDGGTVVLASSGEVAAGSEDRGCG